MNYDIIDIAPQEIPEIDWNTVNRKWDITIKSQFFAYLIDISKYFDNIPGYTVHQQYYKANEPVTDNVLNISAVDNINSLCNHLKIVQTSVLVHKMMGNSLTYTFTYSQDNDVTMPFNLTLSFDMFRESAANLFRSHLYIEFKNLDINVLNVLYMDPFGQATRILFENCNIQTIKCTALYGQHFMKHITRVKSPVSQVEYYHPKQLDKPYHISNKLLPKNSKILRNFDNL